MGGSGREAAGQWGRLGVYSLAHCAVDATCLAILWSAYVDRAVSSTAAWSVFFIYNLLAFATQPLVGLLVDRGLDARWTTVGGGAAVAVAAALALAPGGIYAALAVMALGNAVFHVGGGVVSLRFLPGRAAPVGVFVAPGAAGVLVGTLVGKGGGAAWSVALALAGLLLLVALAATPRLTAPARVVPERSASVRADDASPFAGLGWIVVLLLFVVAVRSYVGVALALPWRSDLGLLIALTAGVVAGKAAGGLLGDRFGWSSVGVGALLVSIPLMLLGEGSAALGIAGVLIFNMTMPITLAAQARALPGRPGLAFGACCLALFAGCALPLAGAATPVPPAALVALGCLAAVALWAGLRLLSEVGWAQTGLERGRGASAAGSLAVSPGLDRLPFVDDAPPPVQ